jgi:hypothetical protein
MRVTPETVAREREWVREREAVVVAIDDVRERLGRAFETEVDPVTASQYRRAVDELFADGDRAVNVAALVALLRDLDVAGDYPGFVVDEQLGRRLAVTVAGAEPLGTLAAATFHYADVVLDDQTATDGEAPAGLDDLDAALAAGFQTRLPGWNWRERESPFTVE